MNLSNTKVVFVLVPFLVLLSGCSQRNSEPVILTVDEVKSLGLFEERAEIQSAIMLDTGDCQLVSYKTEQDQIFRLILMSCLSETVEEAKKDFENDASESCEITQNFVGENSFLEKCTDQSNVKFKSLNVLDGKNTFSISIKPENSDTEAQLKKSYELLHTKTAQFDVFNSFRWILRIIRAAT